MYNINDNNMIYDIISALIDSYNRSSVWYENNL